ncbi:MAG: metallophosphoesterase family protein [Paracoccaceae bacterium]
MLILNVSDIHFKEPQCLQPDTDPDLPYRTRMLQDLRSQVQKLGQVGAIIIVGDIAFKGDPAEYRVAENWIHELVEATGCHLERVFVVPGNHDVDRRVIDKSYQSAWLLTRDFRVSFRCAS